MSAHEMKRRSFFAGLAGAWVAAGPAARRLSALSARLGAVRRPLVVTSKTNIYVKEAVTSAAWETLQKGGTALDAAEKAVNIAELDPRDPSVGFGGDPNEEGFLQLDAAVMDGARGNAAGAVAALENIKTPCSVARLVMERTDHLLLVGKGALKFAKMHGFKEDDLLTEQARIHWRDWKENLNNRDYYLTPDQRFKPEGGGTINVLVLDAKGNMAGVTSTVGHRFKIVGRVGDSPIIGAGLYVDNAVGAAGATGHGEESIKVCSSFLAVEKMREGQSPLEACRYVCRRIVDRHNGRPMFGFKIVALNKSGEYGCCAIRGQLDKETQKVVGLGFAVHDARGHRTEPGLALLPPLTETERSSVPWR